MKTTCVLMLMSAALFASSCSDIGDQATHELNVRTAGEQYRVTDTVRFSVVNSFERESQIAACNLRLTYWLQKLDNGMWQDYYSVNIGPCLALYAPYVVLPPQQSLIEQLALNQLQSLQAGKYRLKIKYTVASDTTRQLTYSNVFDVSN
jgi:hypothetical protein